MALINTYLYSPLGILAFGKILGFLIFTALFFIYINNFLNRTGILYFGNFAESYKKKFIKELVYYVYEFSKNKKNIDYEKDFLYRYFLKYHDEASAKNFTNDLEFMLYGKVQYNRKNKDQKNLPHKLRLQILILLFEISFLKNDAQKKDIDFLKLSAFELGISPSLFNKISSKYIKLENKIQDDKQRTKLSLAYETLNLPLAADIKQVKKAYRELVKQNHPDKFSNTDEKTRQKAEQIMRKIIEAYELIMQNITV